MVDTNNTSSSASHLPNASLSSNIAISAVTPIPDKSENKLKHLLVTIVSGILILMIIITGGIIIYKYFFAKQYTMNAEYYLATGDYNQAKKLFIQAENLWENQANKDHLAEIEKLLLQINSTEKSEIVSTPTPTKSLLPSVTSVPTSARTPTIPPEVADWKTYNSQKYGYSIRYPKDWVNYTMVDNYPSQSEENNKRFFNPTSVKYPAVSINVYVYTKKEFDYLQNQINNYQIENITQENILMGTFSGIKVKGKLQGNPGATAILTNKKYIYVISTEQGDYGNIYDNILLSLRETEVTEKTGDVNNLNSPYLSGLSGSLFDVTKNTAINKLSANIATTVEDGLVATILDAKEVDDYLLVNIQFENTSSAQKTVQAMKIQMHSKTTGTANENNILSFDLSAKEKKSFEFKFLKLLDPPYEFWYLTQNGNHLLLGIYNP